MSSSKTFSYFCHTSLLDDFALFGSLVCCVDELRSSSKLVEDTILQLSDGTEIEMTPEMIDEIVYAYDGLEEENKEKFIGLLTSSEESFDKAYEFCRLHYPV